MQRRNKNLKFFSMAQFIPLRPDFGRDGRSTVVKSNFFAVTSFPTKDIYHYNVVVAASDGKDLSPRFNR